MSYKMKMNPAAVQSIIELNEKEKCKTKVDEILILCDDALSKGQTVIDVRTFNKNEIDLAIIELEKTGFKASYEYSSGDSYEPMDYGYSRIYIVVPVTKLS